ncbi:MAG TPA: hypothetical protein VFJ91_01075 [Gaiellaceae bacterium]|nr:hypothetical protein [Gaiellaceae bacterium]
MRLPAKLQSATWLAVRAVRRLERARQAPVLATLVVVQWLAVLGLALSVRHSGWTWYQGGDQLWYYTSGWLLAHGHLPYAGVGYLWSALLAPFSLALGPDVQDAFPAIVLLDVLVLLPVALLALYGIGRRVGGRVFGYWTCAVWIALPFVGILYVNAGYHQRYVEQFLPQALGLTALADFPALVAVLVSSYFCLRTVLDERPRATHALAAGLAAGAAIGIKPSAAIFLGGPALAYFDARRAREALRFGVALLPAVVTMALWKARSSGGIPVLSSSPFEAVRVAAGATALPLGLNLHRYFNLDWGHLGDELANLRRYFAVGRLVEWGSVAGVFALGRRSAGAAVLAGGWLGSFVVVKGTWNGATLETGSLLRILIPAFPAFVLLIAALPLLWPGLARRLPRYEPEPARVAGRRATVLLVAGLLVTAVIPFAAIAAAKPVQGPNPAAVEAGFSNGPAAADEDEGLRAQVSGGTVTLTWDAHQSAGGPSFYHVFRGPADHADYACDESTVAQRCLVGMTDLGATRATTFVDHPPAGAWRYRIGIAANWLDDTTLGDVYVMSSAVPATVGG